MNHFTFTDRKSTCVWFLWHFYTHSRTEIKGEKNDNIIIIRTEQAYSNGVIFSEYDFKTEQNWMSISLRLIHQLEFQCLFSISVLKGHTLTGAVFIRVFTMDKIQEGLVYRTHARMIVDLLTFYVSHRHETCTVITRKLHPFQLNNSISWFSNRFFERKYIFLVHSYGQ